MDEMSRHLMDWLWVLPTAVAAYGVSVLKELTKTVKEISTSLAVIAFRVDTHDHMLDDHELRLREVELS